MRWCPLGGYVDTSERVVDQQEPTRRRWAVGEKRQIVEETLAAGGSVARVARAHGVNANQVFQWRRLYRAGRLGHPIAHATRLLPVTVSEVTASEPVMATAAEAGGGLREPGSASGTIHIKLPKAQLR